MSKHIGNEFLWKNFLFFFRLLCLMNDSFCWRNRLVFLNLCAAYYLLGRWFFLRETGRKLTHMDRDLIASEGVHEDVPPELWSTRG